MAWLRKVLSAKEKKKENENCRSLDETQNLCQKTGRVFFWQQEA